jgi:hypothetical protein
MFSFMRIALRPLEPYLARLLVSVVLALLPSAAYAQQGVMLSRWSSNGPVACERAAKPCRLSLAASPVLGSFLDKFFSYVNAALGSQHRMLQFGVIGMCIGLFILMKR